MRSLVLAMVLFVVSQNGVYANKSDTEFLKDRVDKLEEVTKKHTDDFDKFQKENGKTFDLFKKEIDIDFKAFKQENGVFIKVGFWLGIGSVLGLIMLVFGFWRFIDKKVKELFEKKLHDKQNSLFSMIDERDHDHKLRQTKSILVLSNGDTTKGLLRNLLVSSKFESVDYADIGNIASVKKTELTIINDYNNGIGNDEKVYEVIQNVPGDMVFYFGPKNINFTNVKKEMASARFPSQVYGNLMSALHYQDSMVKV